MFYIRKLPIRNLQYRYALYRLIKSSWQIYSSHNNILSLSSQKNESSSAFTAVDIENGNLQPTIKILIQQNKNHAYSTKTQTNTKPKIWSNIDRMNENNGDEHHVKASEKKKKTLNSVLCRFAIVSVVVLSFIGVILIWIYMGWLYGLPAVAVAVILILITSGKWRWFYIAAITAPRDIR